MQRGEDIDENCDPNNPKIIDIDTYLEAADMIKTYVPQTPIRTSVYHKVYASNIYFKLESRNKSGSCKDRGILYMLMKLTPEEKQTGVVVASLGNAAVALCLHGQQLGIPSYVVMPQNAPMSLMIRCENAGGKLLLHGYTLMDCVKFARNYAKENNLIYINGRDHPNIIAGYGSIALELIEQVPNMDAVLIPVGTGALAAGIGKVIKERKPKCLVYGLQPATMPAFYKSLENGEMTTVPVNKTMAERLAVTSVGANAYHNLKDIMDRMILVEEKFMGRAMLHLMESEYIVSEASAAACLGALMANSCPELKTKNVVCIISGGNIDPLHFSRCLECGLAVKGRLIKFTVKLRDTTTARTDLLTMFKEAKFNVAQYMCSRRWITGGEYNILEVKFLVNTKNMEHALQLKQIVDKIALSAEFDTEPFNDKRVCPCFIKQLAAS